MNRNICLRSSSFRSMPSLAFSSTDPSGTRMRTVSSSIDGTLESPFRAGARKDRAPRGLPTKGGPLLPGNVQELDTAHPGDAPFCEELCGSSGGHLFGPGHPEDLPERPIDVLDLGHGPVAVVAHELVGHVDDSARVDDEVRRVQDPKLGERIPVLGASELV